MAPIYKLIRIYIVYILTGIVYGFASSDFDIYYNFGPLLMLLIYIFAPINTIFILLIYFSKLNQKIVSNIWILLLECFTAILVPDLLGFFRDKFLLYKFVTVDGHRFREYEWYLTDVALYCEGYVLILVALLVSKLKKDWERFLAQPAQKI